MGAALLLGLLFVLALASDGSSEDSGPKRIPEPRPEKKPEIDPLLVRHALGFKKATEKWIKARKAELSESKQIEESSGQSGTKEANTYAAVLGAAAAAAQSIPVAGNAVGLLLGALAVLVKYLPQGAWLPRIEASDFTGWKEDTFWYHDVPIYAPVADSMLKGMPHPYLGDNSQTYDGLRRLIAYFPNGPDFPVVISVRGQGGDDSYYEYEYSFNFDRPGDLSKSEREAEHLRTMQVWQPEDITPSGPRGFDPSDPWSWKEPGQRRSKITTVKPGDLLI